MKKRSDGVYHFDRGDYVDYLNSQFDPTFGGAVNERGLVSLQNIAPYDRSSAPSGGFGFPIGVGTAPFQLPGDAGGPTTEGEPTYAAEDVVIAQIASANQIPIEEAAQKYYNFIGQPAPAAPAAPQAPATTPAPTPTDDSVFDIITGGAKDAVTAVGGVIDTGLQQLGDLIGMGDPSLVVLNPVNPTASVVYGTPTGNATPTIIGNMPKSGAPVGVITGIPALDNILSGVFNQRGQGGKPLEEIIRDAVLGEISKESGYPVAGVAGAVQGGLGGDLNQVIDSVNKVVLQIDKKVEDADKVDPFSIIKGPDAAEQTGPEQPPRAPGVDTGNDMRIGGGGGTSVKENPDKTAPPPDVVDEVKTILGETPEPDKATPAPSTLRVPSPTVLYGQGMREEKTEKAGLADIGDAFDIGDMSLANVLSLLAGEGDNTQRAPYYGGGSVNRANSVDEILRLLRG